MMESTSTLLASLAADYARLYPGEAAAVHEERSSAEVVELVERSAIAASAPVFAAFTPAAAARILALLPLERASALLQAIDGGRLVGMVEAAALAVADPAQSSNIILTTVTDIIGFFSFLGIATLLMSFL